MLSILPAGVGGNLCRELDNFAKRRDRLRQIYTDTKSCLGEVDYSHHFDPRLYAEAILTPKDEANMQQDFCKSPCFVVLGSSVYAKAAFVNEILGFAALPVVAAEAAEETQSERLVEEKWRTILFHRRSGSSMDVVAQLKVASSETTWSSAPTEVTLRNLQVDPQRCGLYETDLRFTSPVDEQSGGNIGNAFVSFHLPHPLLGDGASIVVPFYETSRDMVELMEKWSAKHILIGIYVFTTPTLTDKDLDNLTTLREHFPPPNNGDPTGDSSRDLALFFVHSRTYTRSSELPESDRQPRQFPMTQNPAIPHMLQFLLFFGDTGNGSPPPESMVLQQLKECGYSLRVKEKRRGESENGEATTSTASVSFPWASAAMLSGTILDSKDADDLSTTGNDGLYSELVSTAQQFTAVVSFVRQVLRQDLLQTARRLNSWHEKLMVLFDMTAFDMARDQIITPKRLAYARNKELDLYLALNNALCRQQNDMASIIGQVMEGQAKEELIRDACQTCDDHADEEEFGPNETGEYKRSFTCVELVQRRVLVKLNKMVADRMTSSFFCLRQTFIGTLTRCLRCLENKNDGSLCDRRLSVDSAPIEASVLELRQSAEATAALTQLMRAAYNMELTLAMCTPFRCLLWDRLREALAWGSSGDSVGVTSQDGEEGETDGPVEPNQPCHDEEWRRHVVTETLDRVSESKLAKAIYAQFRERLRSAHEHFQAALNNLEAYHVERLRKAEEQRLRLRKQHAPRLARVAMESLAIRDCLTHGMPKLGAEVGRGQYGVVYSCERWGTFQPCAVKSVVPPDDKHWNDLALEFHYTKRVPEHERVVRLQGAVIDHSYGAGQSGTMPAVLLVMERMIRDLHSAIRAGFPFPDRLRVALDVVEGLRFLHSQGLVHRDIKLKNVLLNEQNRAKITDLGFCKPEAMMSGSVVGTPIHMAPELFSGQYDSSVDVYAFGVLFWYICAGHVRIPQAFEQCASKDQLWHSVKKGVRPEQLSCFDNQCWDIMSRCWSSEPCKRPHLGDIHPQIEALWRHKMKEEQAKTGASAEE